MITVIRVNILVYILFLMYYFESSIMEVQNSSEDGESDYSSDEDAFKPELSEILLPYPNEHQLRTNTFRT